MDRPPTWYCMFGVKSVKVDLWKLYRMMFEIRRVEERIKSLWEAGLISGEMHLGTGEEAVIVEVVGHIRDGDALALDHRSLFRGRSSQSGNASRIPKPGGGMEAASSVRVQGQSLGDHLSFA